MSFGIFNDEGCVAEGFDSKDDATAFAQKDGMFEDEALYIAEVCRDHEGHAVHECEACNADEDEPESEEEGE